MSDVDTTDPIEPRRRISGWSFARLLAYVLVTVAVIFSVVQVRQESIARSKAILTERSRVGDVFVTALSQGALSGCVNTNKLIYAQRATLKDSLVNANVTYQQLVVDGTFTQAQADRLQASASTQIKQYLARIPYRDCVMAASRYNGLIQNNTARDAEQRSDVIEANSAKQTITLLEQSDAARRAKLTRRIKGK